MAGAISGIGPTQQAVHIDQPLTQISRGYRNGNYIGEQIFPAVKVLKQTDKFFRYTKEYWFRNEVERRGPGTRAVRADYGVDTDTYLCEEYALAKGIPDEVYANADAPLNPLRETTEFLTDQILLNKEIKVADVVFGNSQWSSSATPTTLWDVDTSNPIGDVATATNTVEELTGQVPTIGIVGGALWRSLKQHPDLIDRIKGAAVPGNPAVLNREAIAALFDLGALYIGRPIKNTAVENATVTLSRIWGLHMVVLWQTNSPALMSPNSGYVFQWTPRQANRYREEQEHQDVVEVTDSFDVKLVSPDSGYLIKSAASS